MCRELSKLGIFPPDILQYCAMWPGLSKVSRTAAFSQVSSKLFLALGKVYSPGNSLYTSRTGLSVDTVPLLSAIQSVDEKAGRLIMIRKHEICECQNLVRL